MTHNNWLDNKNQESVLVALAQEFSDQVIQEFILGSAIAPAIMAANVIQDKDDSILIDTHPFIRRMKSSSVCSPRLYASDRNKTDYLTRYGGWIVRGVDPFGGEFLSNDNERELFRYLNGYYTGGPDSYSIYCQTKPFKPRVVKYLIHEIEPQQFNTIGELPPVGTKEFDKVWDAIAKKFKLPLVDFGKKGKIDFWDWIDQNQLKEKFFVEAKLAKYISPAGMRVMPFFPRVPAKPNYWQSILDDPSRPISITEGPKKTLSILSHTDYAAIGIPGIYNWTDIVLDENGEKIIDGWYFDSESQIQKPIYKKRLKPEIARLTPGRTFFIAFDQDKKHTTRVAVNSQIYKLAIALLEAGAKEVLIVDWNPSLGKGIDDVAASGHNIGEIFAEAIEFRKWGAKHKKEEEKARRRARIKHIKKNTQGLRQFTQTPQRVIHKKYFTASDIPSPEEAQFVGLIGKMGTGKTSSIVKALHSRGGRVAAAAHLRSLASDLSGKSGLKLRDSNSKSNVGYLKGIVGCIASWDIILELGEKKEHEEFGTYDIYWLQEFDQTMQQLLIGSPCKNKREKLLRGLSFAIEDVCKHPWKQFIFESGTLTDIEIERIKELIKQLGHNQEVFIVHNTYKTLTFDIHTLEEEPGRSISRGDLMQKIFDDISKRNSIMVMTDAQKPDSAFSTIRLEQHIKKHCQKLKIKYKIIRADSQTLNQEGHEAMGILQHLSEALAFWRREDPDSVLIFICSPSVSSGVSIEDPEDLQLFSSVHLFCRGVLDESHVRQMLSRYRTPVPRFITVSNTAIGSSWRGKSASERTKIQQELRNFANRYLSTEIPNYKTRQARYYLAHLFEFWANCYIEREVEQAGAYKEILLEELTRDGHHIVYDKWDGNKHKKLLQTDIAIGKSMTEQEIQAISTANPIAKEEFEALDKAHNITRDQQMQVEKEKTRRWTEKESSPTYQDIKLFRDLTKKQRLVNRFAYLHSDIVLLKEKKSLVNAQFNNKQTICPWDIKYQQSSWDYILNQSGLRRWLDSQLDPDRSMSSEFVLRPSGLKEEVKVDRIYTNEDPELQGIHRFLMEHAKQIELMLGFSIGKSQSPRESIARMISRYGWGFATVKRPRKADGSRQREFILVDRLMSGDKDEIATMHSILNSWKTAGDKLLEEHPEYNYQIECDRRSTKELEKLYWEMEQAVGSSTGWMSRLQGTLTETREFLTSLPSRIWEQFIARVNWKKTSSPDSNKPLAGTALVSQVKSTVFELLGQVESLSQGVTVFGPP